MTLLSRLDLLFLLGVFVHPSAHAHDNKGKKMHALVLVDSYCSIISLVVLCGGCRARRCVVGATARILNVPVSCCHTAGWMVSAATPSEHSNLGYTTCTMAHTYITAPLHVRSDWAGQRVHLFGRFLFLVLFFFTVLEGPVKLNPSKSSFQTTRTPVRLNEGFISDWGVQSGRLLYNPH